MCDRHDVRSKQRSLIHAHNFEMRVSRDNIETQTSKHFREHGPYQGTFFKKWKLKKHIMQSIK